MKDLEYKYIKRQVLALTGVDLNCYKAPQMQRRLDAYLKQSQLPNWPQFFWALKADPVALSKFKDYLTINVSSLFRDPEKYKYLRTSILPELLQKRNTLRVWSAGCSRGQEAYSVAILLAEVSGNSYQPRILATDIDRSALAWAKAGGPYSSNEVVNIPTDLLSSKYFTVRKDGYWVNETLRKNIIFKQHNLLNDEVTGKFDLIICRNVVIYFESDTKNMLYRRFYKALRPGGVLFVGGAEIIFSATELGFEVVGISFYRRKG